MELDNLRNADAMDESLLRYAEVMNEDQLRHIMSLYGEDIWHYIYYLTGNPEQADDLAQEVFIKCYYRIRTYRGDSTLKAWLFTIARNTVFTYRKSRFFRSGLWGGVQTLSVPDSQNEGPVMKRTGIARSAEMEYLGNRQVDDIWSIIMKLPDKFREILVLDLKSGLSIKEIAELTGLSPGTVKSRLHRARHKVQERIRGLE